MIRSFSKFFRRDRQSIGSSDKISANDDGFTLPQTEKQVPWSNLMQVESYKRDFLTTDLICLELTFAVNGGLVKTEIDEEMEGYDGFVREMELHISVLEKKWKETVMKPAFAKNRIVVYGREPWADGRAHDEIDST